jgi:hypothetical protein
MNGVVLEEGGSFGTWMIKAVQAGTGTDSIFAGDAQRVRHIENQFHQAAGMLAQYIAYFWRHDEASS